MGKLFETLIFTRLWIGRYFGINAYLHWTLVLTLVAFGLLDIGLFGIMCGLFLCVLLHEYGHSISAKLLGVEVGNINLFPIGGVAQVYLPNEDSKLECLITICGPLVNLILCGGFYLLGTFLTTEFLVQGSRNYLANFLSSMFLINLIMMLFNLLPIFPMDGGRILRASMALIMPFTLATKIAARLGQVLAFVLLLLGIYAGFYSLIVVSILLAIGAEYECKLVQNLAETKSN